MQKLRVENLQRYIIGKVTDGVKVFSASLILMKKPAKTRKKFMFSIEMF